MAKAAKERKRHRKKKEAATATETIAVVLPKRQKNHPANKKSAMESDEVEEVTFLR